MQSYMSILLFFEICDDVRGRQPLVNQHKIGLPKFLAKSIPRYEWEGWRAGELFRALKTSSQNRVTKLLI